jgi:NADH-ubiquinone oxidoreductase chain 6
MVIRAKNPVHFVLFLFLFFFNTFSLLVLLGIDFFAMIFLVVYDVKYQNSRNSRKCIVLFTHGCIIGLIFLLEFFFIIDNDYILMLSTKLNTTYLTYTIYARKIQSWTNLETLGNLLYTTYFYLVFSLILLVAMIGAIVLTMHKTTQVKIQDVF